MGSMSGEGWEGLGVEGLGVEGLGVEVGFRGVCGSMSGERREGLEWGRFFLSNGW
jgi:hypothetical protein